MHPATMDNKRPSDNGMDDLGTSKKPHVQTLEGSHAMSASWSWLWNNATFSDIRIMLLADFPRDEIRDQGLPGQVAPVVLLDLPAHKVVTGSMSNHFRKRLMQFEQQMQRDVYAKGNDVQAPNNMQLDIKLNDSPRERLVASARMAAPGVAILDEIIPADWLPAAEIVLKFMYTQELCKPDNVMLLITIARLAERWDIPACQQACLSHLASLNPQQLPASFIGSIMADDLPKSVVEQPLFEPLLEACRQRMVQLFGNVRSIIMNDKLRAAFCALPFSAVRLWAKLDDLTVDSENSVAILLTHWWLSHYKMSMQLTNEAQLLQKDQKVQLSSLVRMNQLTTSFFAGVLQQLPWFGPPTEPWQLLCMAHALHPSKGALLQRQLRDRMPSAWLAPARVKDETEEITTHEWSISRSELEVMHKEAEASRTIRESSGLYYNGCMWTLCLSLTSQKDPLWFGVRVKSALPAAYSVPCIMEAKFTIGVKEATTGRFSKTETLKFDEGAALQPSNCNGTPRLLQVAASTTPRPNSLPPPHLIVDGRLQLQLVIEGMQ